MSATWDLVPYVWRILNTSATNCNNNHGRITKPMKPPYYASNYVHHYGERWATPYILRLVIKRFINSFSKPYFRWLFTITNHYYTQVINIPTLTHFRRNNWLSCLTKVRILGNVPRHMWCECGDHWKLQHAFKPARNTSAAWKELCTLWSVYTSRLQKKKIHRLRIIQQCDSSRLMLCSLPSRNRSACSSSTKYRNIMM